MFTFFFFNFKITHYTIVKMHWSVFQFIEAEQLQAEFSSFTEDISQSGWSDPTINGTTKSKCKSSSLQLFNQSVWNIREYITQDYSENDLQSILLFKMAFNLTYSSIKLQHLSHPQWVMSTSKTKAFSLSQNPMASVASKMKMQTKTFAACQVHRYLTGRLSLQRTCFSTAPENGVINKGYYCTARANLKWTNLWCRPFYN